MKKVMILLSVITMVFAVAGCASKRASDQTATAQSTTTTTSHDYKGEVSKTK